MLLRKNQERVVHVDSATEPIATITLRWDDFDGLRIDVDSDHEPAPKVDVRLGGVQ